MRYSIEPRDRIYVKRYGFLSFARNMSNKYSQKFLDSAKKSVADARAIQKTAEATGDLIGSEIADKITRVSKKSNNSDDDDGENLELATYKKRYISPEERKKIIDELRLVPKNYV